MLTQCLYVNFNQMKAVPHGILCLGFHKSVDFQVVTSAIHGQRRWPHAALRGAWRPASRSLQAHMPAVLQGAEAFSAGLQEESGLECVCSSQWC